jgi:hypothetical protein
LLCDSFNVTNRDSFYFLVANLSGQINVKCKTPNVKLGVCVRASQQQVKVQDNRGSEDPLSQTFCCEVVPLVREGSSDPELETPSANIRALYGDIQ